MPARSFLERSELVRSGEISAHWIASSALSNKSVVRTFVMENTTNVWDSVEPSKRNYLFPEPWVALQNVISDGSIASARSEFGSNVS